MNTSGKKDKNQQIKVFVRVRPLNKQEKDSGSHNIVDVSNNKEIVVKQHMQDKYTKKFTFDKAFGPKSQQVDVFQSVVSPLIEEVLSGYNCTVFAYGQTGTGKTYTMEGGSAIERSLSLQHDPEAGIIPRSLSQLFDALRVQQVEHTVRVSYLELYNEEIFDLLSSLDDPSKLRLYEDSTKKGSVIVHGLEEVTVHNKIEVYKILEKGAEKRQTAATLMNAQSSRSHTIFSITVHIKENGADGEELLKTGKLNLVDLAGSENIGRSGAIEKRAREAGNINQSLLTLGRVITALTERAPHIPYRESKLTRLLQESLGGRTKTSIIATISPALCNVEETLSTLDYAHRARNITNRPEVNQRFTKIALLKQYTEEIERLKRDLYAARTCNGIYIAPEHYDKMTADLENQAHEIIDKINEIQVLKTEIEKTEEICRQLNISLLETNILLKGETQKLNETTNILHKTKQAYCEQEFLVKKHYETEQKLSQQAKTLLGVAEVSTSDLNKLHDTLTKRKTIEGENQSAITVFQQAFRKRISGIQNQIQVYINEQTKCSNDAIAKLLATSEQNYSELARMHQCVLQFINSQTHLNDLIQANSEKQVFINKEFSKTCNDAVETTLSKDFESQKDFLVNHLIPHLELHKQKSEKQIYEHKKSTDVLKEYFEKKNTVDKNFISVLMSDFNNLQTLICTTFEQQQSKLIEFQKFFDKKQEKRLKLLQLVKEFTEDDKNMDANFTQLFTSSQIQINSNLETMKTIMNTQIENTNQFQEELDKCKMSNDTVTIELNKITEGDIANITSCDNIMQDIKGNLTNKENNTKDSIKSIQSHITNYQNEVQTTIDNGSDILSNSFASLMSLKNDENKAVTQTESSLNALQEFVKQSFVKYSQDNVKFSENISNEVQSHDKELGKLFIEQITFYQPTGETPIRKEHKYPKYLAATSPHERLIERFRSQQTKKSFLEKMNSEYSEGNEIVDSLNETRKLVKSVSVNDIINYNCKETNNGINDFEDCPNKENLMETTKLKRSITDLKTVTDKLQQCPKKERRILGIQNIL